MNLNTILSAVGGWLTTSGLSIIGILLGTFIALLLIKVFSKRLVPLLGKYKDDPEYQKRHETLGSVIRYILTIGVSVTAGMMILGELGVEIGPIIAAAGIFGLAIGFGAQSLIKDIISGFFILLENQIRVGDVVVIADKGGLVEKVNLRIVVLRDLEGKVHYIPNNQINTVTNLTKEFSYHIYELGVAYREDIEEVMKVIEEVDEELRADSDFKDDITEPAEIFGLDKFADSALIIKGRIKTKPGKQWRIGREFNLRIKKKFDERNIEIPFPHLTLYMGEDKDGGAPPLNVLLNRTDDKAGKSI